MLCVQKDVHPPERSKNIVNDFYRSFDTHRNRKGIDDRQCDCKVLTEHTMIQRARGHLKRLADPQERDDYVAA